MNGFVFSGSVFALLAVALGAFGAHALRRKVPAERLAVYQTGVQYHMTHALALVAVGVWQGSPAGLPASTGGLATGAGWLFAAGILLFSGSLYALTVTGKRGLGAITPFGGLAFIAGWALLAAAALRA